MSSLQKTTKNNDIFRGFLYYWSYFFALLSPCMKGFINYVRISDNIYMLKDNSLFLYYLLHNFRYITTVYRSYGANCKLICIPVAIRVEHVVTTVDIAIIDCSWPKVRIIRVDINSRRS